MSIRDEIRDRFQNNLDRVKRISQATSRVLERGKDVQSIGQTDILAALVLHASLEISCEVCANGGFLVRTPKPSRKSPRWACAGRFGSDYKRLALLRGRTVGRDHHLCGCDIARRSSLNHPADARRPRRLESIQRL